MTTMRTTKKVALVAHDERKKDLIEWVKEHKMELSNHQLYATGTTGVRLEKETGLKIITYKSGPIGGDQQIGNAIVEENLDLLIFFWDPLQSQPHDPDVKALLRVATLWNTVVACNKATADFLIKSPLIQQEYKRDLKHILKYTKDRTI